MTTMSHGDQRENRIQIEEKEFKKEKNCRSSSYQGISCDGEERMPFLIVTGLIR